MIPPVHMSPSVARMLGAVQITGIGARVGAAADTPYASDIIIIARPTSDMWVWPLQAELLREARR